MSETARIDRTYVGLYPKLLSKQVRTNVAVGGMISLINYKMFFFVKSLDYK